MARLRTTAEGDRGFASRTGTRVVGAKLECEHGVVSATLTAAGILYVDLRDDHGRVFSCVRADLAAKRIDSAADL